MLQGKITELNKLIEEKTKKEQKLNKKIEVQKASIKEWQQNSKKVYKDLKRNEIL
jgi:septal ring factor EnvC (AmiA/AmiB activator)